MAQDKHRVALVTGGMGGLGGHLHQAGRIGIFGSHHAFAGNKAAEWLAAMKAQGCRSRPAPATSPTSSPPRPREKVTLRRSAPSTSLSQCGIAT